MKLRSGKVTGNDDLYKYICNGINWHSDKYYHCTVEHFERDHIRKCIKEGFTSIQLEELFWD